MVGEVEGFGVDVCSQIRAQAADNLRDEAYPFLLWGAGARVLALELLQRFRLLQVSRVKALGEPVVDLCQQLVGCLPLALLLPQATVSRVASRPGVADAAGYRAWRRRTPATLSMFGPFRCTKEPFQRVFCCTIVTTCLACGGIHDPQHSTKGCQGPAVPPGWRASCSMVRQHRALTRQRVRTASRCVGC